MGMLKSTLLRHIFQVQHLNPEMCFFFNLSPPSGDTNVSYTPVLALLVHPNKKNSNFSNDSDDKAIYKSCTEI